MVVTESSQVADLSYADYTNRQQQEVLPEQIESRARQVRPANQFKYEDGRWRPNEYQGFAVVSMVRSHPINASLSIQLQKIQQELIEKLDNTIYYFLPSQSFHQTIANTLSADRFKQNIVHRGIEEAYPSLIQEAFNEIPSSNEDHPVKMKLIGLSIFGTAMGILGVMESESDYKKIVSFRSGFYSNKKLSELSVRMTRPFIGHITIAYVESQLSLQERIELARVLNEINVTVAESNLCFSIAQTELRRYHHLAEFNKESNYPVFSF